MGRGARQDQALNFSNPFRRRDTGSQPREWGEKRFRYRLVNSKGKVNHNPGPMTMVKESLKDLTPVGTGFWQIVEDTALKDERGNLFWDEKVVASYRADLNGRGYIENITNELKDKPLGNHIEERVIDGERYLTLVNRRPYYARQPWKGEQKLVDDKPFEELTIGMEKLKPGKEEKAQKKLQEELKQRQGMDIGRRQEELDRSFGRS